MKKTWIIILLTLFSVAIFSCSKGKGSEPDDPIEDSFPTGGLIGGSFFEYNFEIILSNGDTLTNFHEEIFGGAYIHKVKIPKDVDSFTVQQGSCPYFVVRGFAFNSEPNTDSFFYFSEIKTGESDELESYSIKKTSDNSFECDINRNNDEIRDLYLFLRATPNAIGNIHGYYKEYDEQEKYLLTFEIMVEQ